MLKLPKNRKPSKIEHLRYLLGQVDPAPNSIRDYGKSKSMTSIRPAREGSQQRAAQVAADNFTQALRRAEIPEHVILAALIKLALWHAEIGQGGRVYKILRWAGSEFTNIADRMDGRFPAGKVLKPNVKPTRHRSSKTKSKR